MWKLSFPDILPDQLTHQSGQVGRQVMGYRWQLRAVDLSSFYSTQEFDPWDLHYLPVIASDLIGFPVFLIEAEVGIAFTSHINGVSNIEKLVL